ncbi:hypothetical protein I4F81_002778 [Pyropia yezoensis]|uniref:Uncharacterized protein n=1 Tax=Pyropia yezoensis TaxID=2788 RepID=A0ACC3BQE7_PYRYE|nr:hypothetical protein I4F81_002778 [Neopyropia yezoensis]
MVAAVAAATPHPSAAVPNADILAAWFPFFYVLVLAQLDLDDTALFTCLKGQDVPLPPALSAAGREHFRGGTAPVRKRLLFAGSMGELAAAVHDLVPPLLSPGAGYGGAELPVPLRPPLPPDRLAVAGAALEAATTLALADATAWVDAHDPVDDERLLAQRVRRAASLIESTSRGMARRAAEAEERCGAAPDGRPCARCRQRSHRTGAAVCPAAAVGGDNNAYVYDRGGDSAASDPYACRATVTSSVTVPVAAVLRALPALPDGTAHAVLRDGFLAAAEHHTHLSFTLTLVWLNTVHYLFGAVKADGWAAALPAPARWGEYWNWVSYAVCCRGAHGGSLPIGVQCGSCGRVRDNTLCGPAAGRLLGSYPALMNATVQAMDALASSFDAACHDHLPHRNSHARWRGVVTTIVTHTARTVAVATRRLAWRVATTVVDAADAPACGDEERRRRRAAVYAACKSCLERGSDVPHAAHAAKLELLPPQVRAAALTDIADARARAQPAPPQGIAPLFPAGGADTVARRCTWKSVGVGRRPLRGY